MSIDKESLSKISKWYRVDVDEEVEGRELFVVLRGHEQRGRSKETGDGRMQNGE